MKPLRGATEGATVQSAAYAIYRLLRHVCGCTAGTPEHLPAWQEKQLNRRSDAWSRLSEAQRRAVEMWASLDGVTRHAVLPYLSTNPNMNNTAYPDDPSPLYRPGVRYASWLCRWALQLQARVEKLRDGGAASTEQKRRAELLLCVKPCLHQNDAALALQLIPYLLLHLLHHAPDKSASATLAPSLEEMRAVLTHAEQPAAAAAAPPAAAAAGETAASGSLALCCEATFFVSTRSARGSRSRSAPTSSGRRGSCARSPRRCRGCCSRAPPSAAAPRAARCGTSNSTPTRRRGRRRRSSTSRRARRAASSPPTRSRSCTPRTAASTSPTPSWGSGGCGRRPRWSRRCASSSTRGATPPPSRATRRRCSSSSSASRRASPSRRRGRPGNRRRSSMDSGRRRKSSRRTTRRSSCTSGSAAACATSATSR